PNGIRVVTERMSEARSVSCGVWVGVGGRDESSEVAGASHFLEHLLFKGTDRRSAREIAEAVEAVGGEINAFTAREQTAYYTRLPESQLAFGIELLCDVLAAPALRSHEIDAEREVILEELLAAEDSPEDVVHRLLGEALFPGHPLGRDVLGTAETIEAMGRDEIAGFFTGWYRPANLVVAAAGRLAHDEVVGAIDGFLDGAALGDRPRRLAPTGAPQPRTTVERPIEQSNLALGWLAFDHEDPDRYPLQVLNQVLGGGLSSRLFQEVREERGLVYTIYSYTALYSDSGALAIYAGTGPSKVDEVLAVINGELEKLRAGGITAHELDIARGYLEGSLVLGLEDPGSRMVRIGKSEISRGRVVPLDEHVALMRAVTVADVARVIDRVLAADYTLALVGPPSA
ncbi:MAG: M16 family metallopeptidase, partial [Acidimicrobiales bacterium]